MIERIDFQLCKNLTKKEKYNRHLFEQRLLTVKNITAGSSQSG